MKWNGLVRVVEILNNLALGRERRNIDRREDVRKVLMNYVKRINNLISIQLLGYSVIMFSGRSTHLRDTPPEVKRTKTANSYNLSFIVQDFNDKDLLSAFLAHQLWFQLFSLVSIDRIAEDMAFAVVWDILEPGSTRERFTEAWRHKFPPTFDLGGSLKLSLHEFVKMVNNVDPGKYNQQATEFGLSPLRNKIRMKVSDSGFAYRVMKIDMGQLTKNDILVWNALVHNPHLTAPELASHLDISSATVRSVHRKLNFLFFIRNTVVFRAEAFGLSSYFLILMTKDSLKEVSDWNFPVRITYLEFADMVYLTVVNFLSKPEWLDRIEKRLSGIETIEPPIFGKEEEDQRLTFMAPSLYDRERQRWDTSDKSLNPVLIEQDKSPSTLLERRIFIELLNKTYAPNDLYQVIGGNRNKFFRTLKSMKGKAHVRKEMVLYPAFERKIVIMDIDDRGDFIRTFASKFPYAKMWTISGENPKLVALIGLPQKNSRGIIRALRRYKGIKIGTLVSHPSPSPVVNIKPRKRSWSWVT